MYMMLHIHAWPQQDEQSSKPEQHWWSQSQRQLPGKALLRSCCVHLLHERHGHEAQACYDQQGCKWAIKPWRNWTCVWNLLGQRCIGAAGQPAVEDVKHLQAKRLWVQHKQHVTALYKTFTSVLDWSLQRPARRTEEAKDMQQSRIVRNLRSVKVRNNQLCVLDCEKSLQLIGLRDLPWLMQVKKVRYTLKWHTYTVLSLGSSAACCVGMEHTGWSITAAYELLLILAIFHLPAQMLLM